MRAVAACVGLAVLVASCSPAPPAEPVSVLLLSADSLRTDRLRVFHGGADAPATPHLDALAARGTVYRDAWATAPWTAPAMVSVMTGLYPPSHGIAYRDDTTPAALPTLPRILAGRGYANGNFSFFSEISYFRNLGLGPAVAGLTHRTVPTSFARWLGELPPGEPFFAWVHLLETHLPYGAVGYRASEVTVPGSSGLEEAQLQGTVPWGTVAFADGDRARLLELYDRDVVALDAAIGEVMAALGGAGRRGSTLVVFVADHGEELLDAGWVGHASTAIVAKLLPEILRVPLLLAGPGVPSGRIVDERVQQVDVLPSVLRLVGVDAPEPLDGAVLPGLDHGLLCDLLASRRELAFFDTSPGGNLTPADERGVRLQGVTDGRCLFASRTAPGMEEERHLHPLAEHRGDRTDCTPVHERLATALDGWRREQTAQRLALLEAAGGEDGAPAEEEVATYAPGLRWLTPVDRARVARADTGGLVELAWSGDAETEANAEHWVEYRLLGGVTEVTGAFRVDGSRVVFGPVPEGFWNDLASYSPFRLRVVAPGARLRSEWIEVAVEPAGTG